MKLSATFAIAATLAVTAASAQWLDYPSPRMPLTRGGKPDLAAKAPRTHDGKPDLSGVWQIHPPDPDEFIRLFGDPGPGITAGDDNREQSKYFFNLFVDFKPGEEPLRPEAAAQTQKNRQFLDTPTSHCLPYGLPNRYLNHRPFKIFQTGDALAIFYEIDGAMRQIHLDGRPLPKDPFPSWLGYSTGKWVGETLVVETAGFNDKAWLDARGHLQSQALHVTERLHRRDFGHMDIEATVDDPKILTEPVTIRFIVDLLPNTDVLETFCSEGERDRAHMPSAAP